MFFGVDRTASLPIISAGVMLNDFGEARVYVVQAGIEVNQRHDGAQIVIENASQCGVRQASVKRRARQRVSSALSLDSSPVSAMQVSLAPRTFSGCGFDS